MSAPWSGLRARLSRVTTSGRYLAELDGLRLVAIGLVFVQHVQQAVIAQLGLAPVTTASRLLGELRLGVELFFVLSGFILGLPFASAWLAKGPAVGLTSYFLRRLTRLEPPYVLSMLMWAALLLYRSSDRGSDAPDLGRHLAASLLYAHGFIYRSFSTINPVAWSLEIEVQFYLLAPLLAAALFRIGGKRLRRSLLCVAAVAVVAGRHWAEWRFGALPDALPSHLPYFLGGMMLADLYVTDWNGTPGKSLWADALAALGWAAAGGLFLTNLPGKSLLAAALLTVCVGGTLRGRLSGWLFGLAPISILGGMCYSIYLLHLPIVHYLVPLLPELRFSGDLGLATAAYVCVTGAVVLAASLLFFLLVEMIRRRPVNQRMETAVHAMGFMALTQV